MSTQHDAGRGEPDQIDMMTDQECRSELRKVINEMIKLKKSHAEAPNNDASRCEPLILTGELFPKESGHLNVKQGCVSFSWGVCELIKERLPNADRVWVEIVIRLANVQTDERRTPPQATSSAPQTASEYSASNMKELKDEASEIQRLNSIIKEQADEMVELKGGYADLEAQIECHQESGMTKDSIIKELREALEKILKATSISDDYRHLSNIARAALAACTPSEKTNETK